MELEEQPGSAKGPQAREPDRESPVRESSAVLAGIIASAMDAIITIDSNQKITLFNAAAERMFRCPAADAIGAPLDRFIPHRFREAHRHHVVAFGKTGVTNRAMGNLRPLSALRADGEEFPIEASISQAEVNGRKIYSVILRDISSRVRAEADIHRLNAELEDRVRERTEALRAANLELEGFTYSVAHDLRAPLRHMDAFSRILLEEYSGQLPEEAQHFLRTIRQSSQNLSRLVDDLLNLARIGRQPINREPTPLQDVVTAAIAELGSETAGRKVNWVIHPLPTAECDPRLMKQVVLNLLSNAVKYTRPRPVAEIEVGTGAADGATAVYVRDNGVGFDMRYKDKLFGVFQRLHRSDEFEGTGVGLAIVDRIIRKHGGSVWAESEPGRGATFYFTIDAVSPPAEMPQHQP